MFVCFFINYMYVVWNALLNHDSLFGVFTVSSSLLLAMVTYMYMYATFACIHVHVCTCRCMLCTCK